MNDLVFSSNDLVTSSTVSSFVGGAEFVKTIPGNLLLNLISIMLSPGIFCISG